jgi:hypothetical protein
LFPVFPRSFDKNILSFSDLGAIRVAEGIYVIFGFKLLANSSVHSEILFADESEVMKLAVSSWLRQFIVTREFSWQISLRCSIGPLISSQILSPGWSGCSSKEI